MALTKLLHCKAGIWGVARGLKRIFEKTFELVNGGALLAFHGAEMTGNADTSCKSFDNAWHLFVVLVSFVRCKWPIWRFSGNLVESLRRENPSAPFRLWSRESWIMDTSWYFYEATNNRSYFTWNQAEVVACPVARSLVTLCCTLFCRDTVTLKASINGLTFTAEPLVGVDWVLDWVLASTASTYIVRPADQLNSAQTATFLEESTAMANRLRQIQGHILASVAWPGIFIENGLFISTLRNRISPGLWETCLFGILGCHCLWWLGDAWSVVQRGCWLWSTSEGHEGIHGQRALQAHHSPIQGWPADLQRIGEVWRSATKIDAPFEHCGERLAARSALKLKATSCVTGWRCGEAPGYFPHVLQRGQGVRQALQDAPWTSGLSFCMFLGRTLSRSLQEEYTLVMVPIWKAPCSKYFVGTFCKAKGTCSHTFGALDTVQARGGKVFVDHGPGFG